MVTRGTGAGGANTNKNGKPFEEDTNNLQFLLRNYYFIKIKVNLITKSLKDKTITCMIQNNFKKFIKQILNITMFRIPDEAYYINFNSGRKIIIIVEKKYQYREGSVETKLWACPALKREYEILFGPEYEIHYCLVINEFLKNKLKSNKPKYIILNQILSENNIKVFYGSDTEYFDKINNFIFSF